MSSQDTAPQDLAFNTDGTKMFVVGSSGDAVNEYTLSTGFDVSTATFVDSFSVSSHDTAPLGLAFNTDGTKMFVLGNSGADVNEYTLSTGFDVSTASFVDSFSVSSQETNPLGLAFNTDGTKMFVSGSSGADVNEYTLSTGFDVSTATFVDSFSVSSQDIAPYGLAFNTDGTKMFVVGTLGDDVNEYTLSTGFDVSTASFVDSFSVSSQEAVPVGLAFNTDGTKMFVVGHEGDDVTEYSLTTPFSLVNVSGEHSGDVINTSSTDNYDTDPDDDTLTITSITATTAGGGAQTTFSSNTETVTGSYGTLTINSNGSYQYAATLDATDALDAGDVVTDVFTYIVSDGQGETDTATITITVIGVNDTPVADTETGSVDTNSTLTVTDGTSDLLHGDTDADASASLSVSSIVATTAGGSATAVNPGTAYNSGYTSVTGSYGALRVGADGTYQYIASSSSGTDVFTYTLSDGTATHDATLTITINNSAPTASNSTVYINENNQESTAGDRTPSNITKVFAASDFNFSDTDGGSLSKVKITTLESAGALEYSSNGSTWTDVTENQEITASDISNNKLRFTPAANSESNPTFGFKVHDGTAYSSSAYTMTISVNAAPDVTDATVGSTVAAGATSSGDVHDGVADSDDADSVLVVTGVASGNESSNNTIITNNTGVGSAVSGTYGSLNIAANGTYTYTASSTNNIAYNSTATDIFTFTTRDDETASGSFAYDVGTITFTVASSISLTDDTDSVNEDATVTKTGSQDDVLNDDAADTNGLVVTHIKKDGGSNSTVAGSSTYTSNGTSVTGTYGTLVIGADGSYTYTADQDAADALDLNDVVTDVFVYTADGATANLTITVTGINDAPVATNDTGSVNEDATLSVSNGSGDIIDNNDTDADDSASLVVSAVRIGGVEDSGTAGTVGQALTGTYGQLTLNADGSYSYVANQDAADDLDASDQVTDVFNYTLSDGTATDTATITITVTGINDAPVADNETGAVNEDATLTVTDGTSDVLHGDTDADDSASLTVSAIRTGAEGGSGTAGSIGSGLTGTYGTLTLASDGTYTYVADQSAADDLDASDTVTDIFTYTVSDGTATDTGTITITVTGINDAPVAVNDTDAVNEDATVTRSSGDNLLMADDSDADDDDSFTVTQIAVTGGSNNAVTANSTYNSGSPETVTGTYGTLKVGADGTYTYVADQSASDDLDASDTATDSFTYTVSDGNCY